MTEQPFHISYSKTWREFIESIRKVWEFRMETNPHMQVYEKLSDQTLDAISESGFENTVQKTWLKLRKDIHGEMISDLYFLEMKSFIHGVNDEYSKKDNINQRASFLNHVKTILKSLKDLLEDLPWWAKGLLEVACEVADLLAH